MRENSEPQPIGVASIGSNDIHMLVATTDGAMRFDRLLDRSAEVELVSAEVEAGRHPILPAAAMAEALEVLDNLIARARSVGAHHILAVGTEVLREAENGAAFCSLLAATFGIEALVITGEEEAGLDFAWAIFPPSPGPPESPLLVVDSGGGSTQAIVSQGPSVSAVSLPIGAENLTQRFLAHDPPKARELAELSAHVSAMMDQLPSLASPAPAPAAVLMGGSADHVLAFAAQPKQRHLSLGELDAALAVAHRKPAVKLARDYKLPAKRGRLVAAGAAILRQVLGHYGVDAAQVKADGIRGGLIVRYARHGNAWRAGLGLHSGPGVRTTSTEADGTAARTRAQRSRSTRNQST